MLQTRIIPEFTLESGARLREAPVAYQTWGTLNEAGDNAIVVCHALTGNTAIDEWWGDLLGPGRVLDPNCHFIVAANVPGSPYGTVSPLSVNPDTGTPYGPAFPVFTVRDCVRLHQVLLDLLGVNQVQLVIGGSMGGMQVLEWALLGEEYVQAIVPIAVGGRHSAWCIGWSEMQRQAIYADPRWRGGAYDPADGPTAGLSVARMAAMISYRSQASFQERFGRIRMTGEEEEVFSIESYLRYQGLKLTQRFDANCYVRLTQLMDSHDVSRGRGAYPEVLRRITQPALVIGITSDILYPLPEQEELYTYLPDAELYVLDSADGHDAFLIDVDAINRRVSTWMRDRVRCRRHEPAYHHDHP